MTSNRLSIVVFLAVISYFQPGFADQRPATSPKAKAVADPSPARPEHAQRPTDDNDPVIAACTKAIRRNPHSIDFCRRGQAYQAQAMPVDPRHPGRSLTRRAESSRAQDKLRKAILDYTEAILLRADFREAYKGRGDCYTHMGDYDKAIADYSEVMRITPKRAEAYADRARPYLESRQFDQALADCTKAIQLDPKWSEAYLLRGGAYAAKGDDDKAIADFSEAVRLDPKDAVSYHRRGVSYLEKNDRAKADKDFEQAKKLGYKSQ